MRPKARFAFLAMIAVGGMVRAAPHRECIPEEIAANFHEVLDAHWPKAVRLSGMENRKLPPRPHFCFDPQPAFKGGWRILATYDAPSNEAAIYVTPEEMTDRTFECVVVHEMLHALLGRDNEVAVRRAWPDCWPVQEGDRIAMLDYAP